LKSELVKSLPTSNAIWEARQEGSKHIEGREDQLILRLRKKGIRLGGGTGRGKKAELGVKKQDCEKKELFPVLSGHYVVRLWEKEETG